ncbi:DUF2336 domain-containing protein [Caulobacter sp. S45]|uniref:DUF2336 domain-containing protein n=1 Tax=Caulobacter sp. S45 TaxID=1641861 RepID=UPI001575FE78|nr:DUF2336 domain-containing protein [Caulobacter sp. S45]
MAAARSALTQDDIRTLVRGVTADERAIAAHKLCRRIDAGLGEEDRDAAAEVLRLMALDAAELVRRALAVTLKTSRELPHDVAVRLAHDVESVATPVLTFSPVLTDDDLAAIVALPDAVKQLAVARRPALSEAVTTALVRHAGEEAVKTACANDNAHFTEAALGSAIARFADSNALASAMALRKILPAAICERLVSRVSESVRQQLVDRHQLSPETALSIAIGTRERATVDLVDQAGRAADLKAFTAHLHAEERLTASLLLRALANGHMTFFEWGMAELSAVAHHRAWMMVHDAGPLGLKAIYGRAGLPEGLYPAFRVAVDTYHALQQEGGDFDLRRFQQRMLERFLTQETAPPEEVDYLLERMDRLDREAEAPALAQAG